MLFFLYLKQPRGIQRKILPNNLNFPGRKPIGKKILQILLIKIQIIFILSRGDGGICFEYIFRIADILIKFIKKWICFRLAFIFGIIFGRKVHINFGCSQTCLHFLFLFALILLLINFPLFYQFYSQPHHRILVVQCPMSLLSPYYTDINMLDNKDGSIKQQVQLQLYNIIQKNYQSCPMKTSQRLISEVNQFLKQKQNIQISLPRLHSLIDSKVNLKITSPTISTYNFTVDKNSVENRYKTVITYIESLLSSSSLDINAIDTFMGVFNKIINTDIEIIQKNETIRNNSFKIKEKLQFRVHEISKRTQILSTSIEKIHDKVDIITFLAIDIKNYLLSMKLISDQYEQVKAVQVHTPLKIDHIYQFEYSSEQDYQDHYEPLLQVLVRLRANMVNLHHSVRNCDRIDLPLKSVNLLANCKNLLMELQQYLITDHCAYNRLIFHVVTQQSQNMKIISNFYKNYLDFVKSLVYNVYKCVYLGNIFKKYYIEYTQTITQQKNKIIDLILKINVNIKPQAYIEIERNIKVLEQNLHTIRSKIKIIQNILCYDKTTIMHQYLQQKICKKLSRLLELKNQLIQLQNLLKTVKLYIKEVRKIDHERVELVKNKSQIEKEIVVLGQDTSKKDVMYYGDMAELNADRLEKIFNATFVVIQEKSVKVAQLDRTIKDYQKQCKYQKITQQFFPKLLQVTKQLRQQYYDLQIKLLNTYEHMLSDQSQKQAQAIENANQTIQDILTYLKAENKEKGATYSSIGGEILNQDQHCEVVKGYLGSLDKAEFMLKSIRKKKKGNSKPKQSEQIVVYTKQLQKLRKYLEYLLCLYEASMDDHILQSMVDKMDFNQQSDGVISKNINKVKQLMGELEKHNKQLRKKSKQIRNKKTQNQDEQNQLYQNIDAKVVRIVRQRHVLYEILEVIYGEFLSVYVDLKSSKNGKKQETYDLQTKGVLLFNKKVYNYVLLCYHCLNKINVVEKQLNDSNLALRTKNYLTDDIVQPFTNRLKSFIKFNEEEMLNLTLKLEKSIQIQKQYKNRLKKWQQTIEKNEASQAEYRKKIKQKSKQLLEISNSMQQIEQLNKKKFVLLNLQDLKKIQKQCEQHFEIADDIVKLEEYSQVCQGKLFKNQKLNALVKKIQKYLPTKQ